MKRLALLLALGLMPGIAGARAPVQAVTDEEAGWTRELNTALLANPSATAVLQKWCADRHIAEPAVIRAVVDRGAFAFATPEQRVRLNVSKDDRLAYRRVQLMCGDMVLSEAENWYVPARLTPEMNTALAGDTPFGTAIRPLKPVRETLSTEFEWQGQSGDEILRHRALVIAADGSPLAEVVETYQRNMLKPAH